MSSPRLPRLGFTLIELCVVMVVIGVLVAIALPSYVRLKDKAREAEVKSALHSIQLSVERFGVDHEGSYPPYLIGGDNRYMTMTVNSENIVRRELHDSPESGASDPLIRGGYVDAYPHNPFVAHSKPVQLMQQDYGDPLRSSFPDGQQMGTRFGAQGANMGQALCEARWLTWNYIDPASGETKELNTWANVQYEFYDVWLSNHVQPYLPGSFMYKSFGEVAPKTREKPRQINTLVFDPRFDPGKVKNPDDATIPLSLSDYMLCAWGGLRSKGDDLLGEEPLVMFSFKTKRQAAMSRAFVIPGPGGIITPPKPVKSTEKIELLGVPPWTRGVNRTHVGPLWGSPYGPSGDADRQLSYGNNNGVRDGLIIMLTPGRD
jgi:prepilin-type N-terminal cleavage/methylation domain-containing protein